jgi:hypothetical protein
MSFDLSLGALAAMYDLAELAPTAPQMADGQAEARFRGLPRRLAPARFRVVVAFFMAFRVVFRVALVAAFLEPGRRPRFGARDPSTSSDRCAWQ